MTRRKALPPAPAGADPAVRQWMESVREQLEVSQGVRGSSLDQSVTFGDIIDIGLASFRSRGRARFNATDLMPSSEAPNLTIPPAPAFVEGIAGIGFNTITFQIPLYGNHGFAEIWRAEGTGALLGAAVKIGTANGTVYSDFTAVEGIVYVYWVRFISTSSIAGPYHASLGVELETLVRAATVLEDLEGQLSEIHLQTSLVGRIDLIDAEETGLVHRVGDLETIYGDTVSAAQSASDAADAAADAIQARVDAILAGDAAGVAATDSENSRVVAEAAKTDAETSASAAFTSEQNADAYATDSEAAATASNTERLAAETARDLADGYASAAFTSQQTAVASATDAGTFAAAAEQRKIEAETAAGNASVSETNSATSETNADGSATSAAASASQADSSATAAAGSATAASGFASSSESSADDSQSSATAANTSRVEAESARDAAQASSTAAAGFASTAESEATDAAQSAQAANSSETNANTSAANASTFATQASQAATTAEGHATAAAQDFSAITARLDDEDTGLDARARITSLDNVAVFTGVNLDTGLQASGGLAESIDQLSLEVFDGNGGSKIAAIEKKQEIFSGDILVRDGKFIDEELSEYVINESFANYWLETRDAGSSDRTFALSPAARFLRLDATSSNYTVDVRTENIPVTAGDILELNASCSFTNTTGLEEEFYVIYMTVNYFREDGSYIIDSPIIERTSFKTDSGVADEDVWQDLGLKRTTVPDNAVTGVVSIRGRALPYSGPGTLSYNPPAGFAVCITNLLCKSMDQSIRAEHSVKLDVNGNISGISLFADEDESTVSILADNFALWDPGSNYANDPADKELVIGYSGGELGIDGVYIKTATIDDASIIGLTAAKITAGELTSGTWIKGGDFFGGQLRLGVGSFNRPNEDGDAAGYSSVIDSNGNAYFENAYVRGDVRATSLSADSVSASSIQSGAVEAGKIAANAITTSSLNSNIITTDQIVSDAVTKTAAVSYYNNANLPYSGSSMSVSIADFIAQSVPQYIVIVDCLGQMSVSSDDTGILYIDIEYKFNGGSWQTLRQYSNYVRTNSSTGTAEIRFSDSYAISLSGKTGTLHVRLVADGTKSAADIIDYEMVGMGAKR